MIRGRVQLVRMLQGMFETHLRGLYRWGEIAFHVAEAADKPEGKRKNAYGKFKEIVAIRFGPYDLTVESPNEKPPLGHILLTSPDGTMEFDSLDASVLDEIGRRIRSQHEEVVSYG